MLACKGECLIESGVGFCKCCPFVARDVGENGDTTVTAVRPLLTLAESDGAKWGEAVGSAEWSLRNGDVDDARSMSRSSELLSEADTYGEPPILRSVGLGSLLSVSIFTTTAALTSGGTRTHPKVRSCVTQPCLISHARIRI